MEISSLRIALRKFWRTNVRRLGQYEIVVPHEVTLSREVPDHILRPNNDLPEELFPDYNVEIKDSNQIIGMKRSCKLAANILASVKDFIKVGITTDYIDEFVHNQAISNEAYPSPLHYKGFPKSVCTSVNNVVVHGIPDLRPLKDGDIINVDVTVYYRGFHGDCSKTFLVGNVDDKGKELVAITEECLDLAIKTCGPGVLFSEIGSVISNHAKKNNLTVIPAFIGHGIGQYFHGPPEINHTPNTYPGVMKPGMTFTIEPALSHGGEQVIILEDGWTAVTEDDARTAQVEHTVLITENGAEVLTDDDIKSTNVQYQSQ